MNSAYVTPGIKELVYNTTYSKIAGMCQGEGQAQSITWWPGQTTNCILSPFNCIYLFSHWFLLGDDQISLGPIFIYQVVGEYSQANTRNNLWVHRTSSNYCNVSVPEDLIQAYSTRHCTKQSFKRGWISFRKCVSVQWGGHRVLRGVGHRVSTLYAWRRSSGTEMLQ